MSFGTPGVADIDRVIRAIEDLARDVRDGNDTLERIEEMARDLRDQQARDASLVERLITAFKEVLP